MSQDTNLSIIQLIKLGEVFISNEISNIRAGRDVNVHIRTYLEKSDHYQGIQQHIREAKSDIQNAKSMAEELHFDNKLQNLLKVEKDFISNTLYLADTLSKIEPRTDRLKKVILLFEEGKIREADAILDEADLLNDQFNLIAFVEYQRNKIKTLKNEFNITSDQNPKLDRK